VADLVTTVLKSVLSYQRVSYSTLCVCVCILYECQTGHLFYFSAISIPASYSAGHEIDSRLGGLSIPTEIFHGLSAYLQTNTGI